MTLEYLLWCLDFNRKDGTFTWKRSSRAGWVGRPAGCISGGRCIIRMKNKGWRRSHLVWLVKTGSLPPEGYDIDHKNRIKSDDRPANLRLATRAQNCMNKDVQANNTIGHRNIHARDDGKFIVQIQRHGVRIGKKFDTLEEAIAFRNSKIGEFHGSFKGAYDRAKNQYHAA